MSGNENHHCQGRRFTTGGNGHDGRDPRDVEIERLRQRVRELEMNSFDRYERQYEDTPTDTAVEEYENEGSEFEKKITSVIRASRPLSNDTVGHPRWDHVQNQRYREGKHWVESWDKMKRLMEKKFLPVTHKQDSYVEFHTLKQQTLTVEEFIAEFERVRMHCGVEENEEQTIARFLGSLRTDISDVVYLQQYYSFHDVCRLALKVEKQLSAKQKTTTRFGSSSRAPQSATGPVLVGPIKSDPPALIGVLTLIDEADLLYDTKDEVETEVVYLDRGELLVTRRLLNTNFLDQDNDTTWLRTNIFRTQCTAKGKICTVIIDGGSCENMVSTTMVENFGLPIHNHPDLYQLTWLKKGNLVKVTHRCLVHFSIGDKYTDELWCEVILMDACHILLGHPWLYDRRVKHDGYCNTYTFKKDGVSITLAPLNSKDAPPDRVLISKTDFVGLVKVSPPLVVFGLLMIEENPITAAAPLSMVPLLNEFKDVFPEEILAWLHVIREIQHCIDFLPGASIPNKLAYRMNLKEFAEFVSLKILSRTMEVHSL
nr:hypothetical protein [Tanacetum cinerariifolium]